ncbi:hypothetical protein BTN49_1144 [Candidatus Enterovibrio escicola]|uniref:Uncharacterized protein n=1 Tax=Candidatus Enterovibrio escicola TaxID=1927127 RepID=A0A2A5T4U0_9GAMM|nr:hypothetical protein BTN49_1144 [Candidatus Enterovibrio escacola]
MCQAALITRHWFMRCHCILKTKMAIINGELRSDTNILVR